MNCKFETVELTFQLKTAYEFSKNLVSDAICFNVRETSFDMTNRNISIIIKTKVTSNGIKLSLIWMHMLSFTHWKWDSPFLSCFYKIYWDAVDKLKKEEMMFTVKIRITLKLFFSAYRHLYFCMRFLKLVGKFIMGVKVY